MVYAFLLGALRLAGRRELAQMTSFDLVLLLVISNAVQNSINAVRRDIEQHSLHELAYHEPAPAGGSAGRRPAG